MPQLTEVQRLTAQLRAATADVEILAAQFASMIRSAQNAIDRITELTARIHELQP